MPENAASQRPNCTDCTAPPQPSNRQAITVAVSVVSAEAMTVPLAASRISICRVTALEPAVVRVRVHVRVVPSPSHVLSVPEVTLPDTAVARTW